MYIFILLRQGQGYIFFKGHIFREGHKFFEKISIFVLALVSKYCQIELDVFPNFMAYSDYIDFKVGIYLGVAVEFTTFEIISNFHALAFSLLIRSYLPEIQYVL